MGGLADEPQHRGVAVVAQTGEVEDGLDTAAERVADGRAGAGEGGETVGEVLAAEDVDGPPLDQRGADAVGARGRLGGAEAGGEVHVVEAGQQLPVAAVPLDHTGLPVAEHDGHAHMREGGGELREHRVCRVEEGVLHGEIGCVGDQQTMRFEPRGTAPLPGVEHRVADIRVDRRTGEEALMGIDETADAVPGDGQRDHFPRLEANPVALRHPARPRGRLPSASTLDLA
nr:hypothetical protein [Streptomyces capitiformicae]